uniref:glycoside hydrolase family 9 protein n=1 Tax=uncultured Draconibacterium sp. TaxID=1573823 RepID=UPI003216D8A4
MKHVFLIVLCVFTMQFVKAKDPTNPLIITNHIGYEKTGYKQAVILGFENDNFENFQLIDYYSNKVILSGKTKAAGKVDNWKNWHFWTIDFSSIKDEGKYIIESISDGKKYTSYPFRIQEQVLERNTISDIVYYFRGQRAVGLFEQADANVPVVKHDGENETEVKRIDARGGWADATGDYSKVFSHLSNSEFFNPQQIPLTVWTLFKSYEELCRRNEKGFAQVKKRMIDEAIYGADYLVNSKIPGGSFYRSVSCWGKKLPSDRKIHPVNREINEYNTNFREGAGVAIASLALASTNEFHGIYSNEKYLETAEEAFDFLVKNNQRLVVGGKENMVDDYCSLIAAVELYKATNNPKYKAFANNRGEILMNRLVSNNKYNNYWRADDGDRPFFHAADAGFPVVALLNYSDIADENVKQNVLSVVKKSLEFDFAISEEVTNPFNYTRQYVQHKDGKRESGFFFIHDSETAPWWQGENARLASIASAMKLATKYFSDDKKFVGKLRKYAVSQLNWILGLNPYDACMLEGSGHNNPQYLFYGSYEYKNAPGGIVNGITAGLHDYHDIDFEKGYVETGNDDDWRWVEQWLPHASWFMYAVSLE